jgi:hypothetical protein
MRVKFTAIALVVGLSMTFGPWIFFENPSKNWFWISVCGVVLASIAGYNSQAGMIGLGEPGEELLQSWWKAIKKWISKKT